MPCHETGDIMARYGLAGALLAVALVVGCGSSQPEVKRPAYTDDEIMAGRLSTVLHNQPLSAAKNGPEAGKEAALDLAIKICRLLNSAADAEIISTRTDYPGNPFGVSSLVEGLQNETTWTEDQTLAALSISSEHKCPEFSPMLIVYEAGHAP